MEILKALGVSDEQLKKISPELSIGLEEMKSIAPFLEAKNAPINLVEAYNGIDRELNNYLKSPRFAEDAKKAGVRLKSTSISEEEEIVISEAPKVKKTLKEIAAERKAKKATTESTIYDPTTDEPTIYDPTTDEPTTDEQPQRVEVEEGLNGVKLYKTSTVTGGGYKRTKRAFGFTFVWRMQ